ncbi:MAG: invasion associated locus B family protein [Alphaproteobacteria bacterium]|nr:invasion associated locus B family protein [Alphaproteobacteria bacterium]
MRYLQLLVFGLIGLSVPVFAADKNLDILGTYDDWTAYIYTDQGNKTCYMATEPIKSVGKYKVRDDVFLFVTHHPTEKEFDIVNVMAGYTYKKGSKPSLTIDKNKAVSLVSHADTAWAKDSDTDKKLVAQMKKGSTAVLKGTSARGTLTTDTFSMKGFSKAYHDIQKACGRE